MSEAFLIDLGRRAFLVTLALGGPILGMGMAVGLLVAILQAVTSVQEMTLTFVPKIVAVMAAVAFFGPWMLTVMLRFTFDLFTVLPSLAP